ncbi:hypothetical protein ILUMI_07714 [Ignelater luminosus]|uniref:PiggyBac transposable element-derived protein domain-containing protein n=1 Tax=Ignelater luminosus TaxID=2038154 RepID=A0A8K0D7R2_IGNLU|nr:hypothetical protein ILUMI_07714 [Ignelater luminosus]
MEGTLGERVVNKLISILQERNVVLAFDRFFTSVKLLNEIPFRAVGTEDLNSCVMNEEVMFPSNCHTDALATVQRISKIGTKIDISCPEAIEFYSHCMGGVDLGDQMAGLNDLDRKSLKWWKKIFYMLVMVTAVNGWIIFNDVYRKKTSFVEFLVTSGEDLVPSGRQAAAVKTRRRLSGRTMINLGDYLPIVQKAGRHQLLREPESLASILSADGSLHQECNRKRTYRYQRVQGLFSENHQQGVSFGR